MPSKRISIIVVVLLLIAGIAWFAVKPSASPPPAAAKESHAHEAEEGEASHVEMDQAKIAKAGIAIATAAPATLQNRLRLFGRIGANYMSKRYFTYENDQSVPGRVLFDATVGVHLDIDPGKAAGGALPVHARERRPRPW